VHIRLIYDKEYSRKKSVSKLAVDLSLIYGEPRRYRESYFWWSSDTVLAVAKAAKTADPKVKVILVTAFGSHEITEKASEYGVDVYLEKPVSLLWLRQILTDFGLGPCAGHQ